MIAAATLKAWRECSPMVDARQLQDSTGVFSRLISRATLFLFGVILEHDLPLGSYAMTRWLL